MKFRVIIICLLGAMAAMCVTSCRSSRSVTASSSHRIEKGGGALSTVKFSPIDKALESTSRALLTEAKKWLGTPYKYGGNDMKGVDCSGLVLCVFRDALNIKLPRSSSQQKEYSSSISKRDLIPGDLLFFATTRGSKKVSHVGMYIGEGKMIHSSSSRGVMVSQIEEDYFVRTFAGAGRIDAYYAMLSKKGKKKKAEKPAPEVVEPSSQPSFRYEPVAEIPSRKTPVVTPPAPVPAPVTPVVAQAVEPSDVPVPELSADDARRQVLNSLIEEKLDSIYAQSPQ